MSEQFGFEYVRILEYIIVVHIIHRESRNYEVYAVKSVEMPYILVPYWILADIGAINEQIFKYKNKYIYILCV